MITPAPVLKYAQATYGGEDEGDDSHGGEAESGDGGSRHGAGIEDKPIVDQDNIADSIAANIGISDDIAIVDQDNIPDQDAANIGIQDQDLGEATDFGGIGPGTGDRTALEKEIEELWGTK